MEHAEQPHTVRVDIVAGGALTYLVDAPPEALPPVRGRDLERAWYAAREAAMAASWGAVRGFRFRRPDGSFTELALADRDACCWAAAVDQIAGLTNDYGLSLCLRLLALVDLLTRARWAVPLCRLERDGADLHPSLLRAAAATPLTPEARFDEDGFRARLIPSLAPSPSPGMTGASAPPVAASTGAASTPLRPLALASALASVPGESPAQTSGRTA
jgi:hypothetical protein